MSRHRRVLAGLVALVTAVLVIGSLSRSPAQDKSAPAEQGGTKPDSPEAAVRKTAEAFMRAFNAGDAKAAAAFWAKDGEYIGPDGEEVRGRAAIEKDFVDSFKKHPKARMEIQIGSIRVLGRHTVLEEGTITLHLPGETEPGQTRYSALHVLADDGWRLASVREWVPDAAELVSLQDLAWLVGEWVARSKEVEVRVTYSWGEDKITLRGRYLVKKDSKEVSSGTQVIGKDPARGLRSVLFDKNGAFGESVWARDGKRWIVEAGGSLPVPATNRLCAAFSSSSRRHGVSLNGMPAESPAANSNS